MKIDKTGKYFGHFLCCPKCGKAETFEQMEWDDLGYGEQTEINRQERWHCSNCDRDQMIIVHYITDRYTLANGEFDDLEEVSDPIPVDLQNPAEE